ncbi:hypothetical protein [Leucothrix mucor]|uniref:hypothetical protein n=1 Tax=Leucothrix mucor TaxID=45248 RepID=UPI0003B54965|nr:hypothetical protein [Leucothrix mucor]
MSIFEGTLFYWPDTLPIIGTLAHSIIKRVKIKNASKYWLQAYDIYNELGNEPKKKFGKGFIDKNCKS